MPPVSTLIFGIVGLARQHLDEFDALGLRDTKDAAREVTVHVEIAAAGGLVARCHRVLDQWVTLAHFVALALGEQAPKGAHEIVLGGHRVHALTNVVGESVVGRVHVGKQGVATHRRHGDCVQHGTH